MKTLGSLLAALACVALLSAPAMAQSSTSGQMPGMAMPAKTAKAKKPMKTAAVKLTCMDYAWQSQDEKDCEAGKIKPPHWR
jgi:hypothetical protein